jgi:D-aspartate ligase
MASLSHQALRRYRPERPPVLLLGGLNLLRPLGMAGIPVIVGASAQRPPAKLSRYCDAVIALPPVEDGQALVRALEDAGSTLAETLGRPVPLLYGNADYLRLIQEHRQRLEPRFRLLLNDPEIASQLIEKHRFQALAMARKLPVPRELDWEALPEFFRPVLAKPKNRFAWDDSAVHVRLLHGRGKARVFRSGRALAADPVASELRQELSFQEYVAGDDRQLWSYHGFADERAELLAWFIGRKLRTYPALTGASAYVELAREAALERIGREIVRRVPLRGVFKMDFKQDAYTGRFYLLEVNARYNLWHYVGARNGINLPGIAYDYLVHGKRPAANSYRTRFRWLSPRLDWLAYRQLAAEGKLGLRRWLGSLAEAPKLYDGFAWTDPLPAAAELAQFVRSRVPGRLKRMRLRLRQWLSTAS